MKPSGFLLRMSLAASLAAVCLPSRAIEGSAGTVVLDTKASVFWRTAPSSAVTVPVDFPAEATAAVLAVTGVTHRAVYTLAAEGDFTFQLPAPDSPQEEDIYALTLSFNDGTVREASIAGVAGAAKGNSAAGVRVNFEKESRKWQRVRDCRAVLPVPYAAKSLKIDGETVDTGLDGAAGWYLFRPEERSRKYALVLTDSESDLFETTLFGADRGLGIIFK
jgi:hypothetical protein